MEAEVIHTVLTEVPQELKEIRQQQTETAMLCLEMKDKVEGIELRLIDQNRPPSLIETESIMKAINEGFQKVQNSI